tara:strand:- start:1496 stop:2005 length:510 start_codon:yes stop_codon:yes gene_type:complete
MADSEYDREYDDGTIDVSSNFDLTYFPKEAAKTLAKIYSQPPSYSDNCVGDYVKPVFLFKLDGEMYEYVLRRRKISNGQPQKIVFNTSYGGFTIPDFLLERLRKLTGDPGVDKRYFNANRDNPYLVQAVEELDEKTRKKYSLDIEELPADAEWTIAEYDGLETVETIDE